MDQLDNTAEQRLAGVLSDVEHKMTQALQLVDEIVPSSRVIPAVPRRARRLVTRLDELVSALDPR